MTTTLRLLLFLCIATMTSAVPVLMPVGELRLLDGRILKNAVIRSYDAEASKALVMANGQAVLIPIKLIPPPYVDKLQAEGSRITADLLQTTPSPAPAERTPASPETGAVYPPSPAPRPAPAPVAPAAEVIDPRLAHQEVAKARALRYFKYEFRAGSNSIAVTDSDIEINETEAVPGWNQYRTTGKAYVEFYDSAGGSFSRRARQFEVITGQKPGEEIKVVEFKRK